MLQWAFAFAGAGAASFDGKRRTIAERADERFFWNKTLCSAFMGTTSNVEAVTDVSVWLLSSRYVWTDLVVLLLLCVQSKSCLSG